jgi:hypothetical protein
VFDPGQVARDRPGPDRDRLTVAQLTGAARRHAGWHEPTEAETAAAAAELRDIAGGRPELLAEVAGLLLGFHEGGLGEPKARAAAQLCLAAGADAGQVALWAEEGRHRAGAARMPPFSRPGRTPRP